MNFRTVRNNIISILDTAAAGRYVAVQGQKQKEGSQDINNLPKVAVFFIRADFPESSSSANDTTRSDVTFQIELKVSEKSTATDLTDPSSIISAEIAADNKIDELFEIVYQVIMDADNLDLGLSAGVINNRYIKTLQKGAPDMEGERVVLVGRADLTLKTSESVGTTTETEGTTIINDFGINDDSIQKTGITVNPNA